MDITKQPNLLRLYLQQVSLDYVRRSVPVGLVVGLGLVVRKTLSHGWGDKNEQKRSERLATLSAGALTPRRGRGTDPRLSPVWTRYVTLVI